MNELEGCGLGSFSSRYGLVAELMKTVLELWLL
jgi:hypothetical protein